MGKAVFVLISVSGSSEKSMYLFDATVLPLPIISGVLVILEPIVVFIQVLQKYKLIAGIPEGLGSLSLTYTYYKDTVFMESMARGV